MKILLTGNEPPISVAMPYLNQISSMRKSREGNMEEKVEITDLHLLIHIFRQKVLLDVCRGRRFEVLEVEFVANAQKQNCVACCHFFL